MSTRASQPLGFLSTTVRKPDDRCKGAEDCFVEYLLDASKSCHYAFFFPWKHLPLDVHAPVLVCPTFPLTLDLSWGPNFMIVALLATSRPPP